MSARCALCRHARHDHVTAHPLHGHWSRLANAHVLLLPQDTEKSTMVQNHMAFSIADATSHYGFKLYHDAGVRLLLCHGLNALARGGSLCFLYLCQLRYDDLGNTLSHWTTCCTARVYSWTCVSGDGCPHEMRHVLTRGLGSDS